MTDDSFYAGIGSRKTPSDIMVKMQTIAYLLAEHKWILRSGGAKGADSAFEKGCDKNKGGKEIYLPWSEFNHNDSFRFPPSIEAFKVAKNFHPKWQYLNSKAKKLMARNSHQVLGEDMLTPVKMVICYTDDGKISGGTGQAMRIAKDKNIPIYNMKNISYDDLLFELNLK